jgi:hypothetical protein
LQDLREQQERLPREGQQRGELQGLRQRGDRLEPRLAPQLRQLSRRRRRQQRPLLEDGGDEAAAAGLSPPDPAG